MTRSVKFDSPPLGVGPWWCEYCHRATVTSYRCSNYDCGKDLAGRALNRVTLNGSVGGGEA